MTEFKLYENNGSSRYQSVSDYGDAWIVQVNDNNGKNSGQIYVEIETGKILKVIINGKVLKDIINQEFQTNTSQQTNITNINDQLPQNTSNNTTGIILAAILILIIAGTGYWFKIKK